MLQEKKRLDQSKGFSKSKNVKVNKSTVGVITLGLVVIFNLIFSNFKGIYEVVYQNGLFQLWRIIHDFTIGLLPIPSLYLIVPAFFYYFLKGKFGSVKQFFLGLLTTILWIINLFYILWGFNYNQPSLYDSLQLTPVTIDQQYIKRAFLKQTAILEALAPKTTMEQDYSYQEELIRTKQEQLLSEWGISTVGKVRIRKVPAGSLLRIRTSGIYIPHALEGHLDKGLYVKQHPFTLAHEMAHGYSYTDESVCNFIAYLTCSQAEDVNIRYSAELAYWRYLSRYFAHFYPEEWDLLYSDLQPELLQDLEEIKKHISKYKDLMPVMRDVIYDNYLKSHGVKAGIKSYDLMIELIAAYDASGR